MERGSQTWIVPSCDDLRPYRVYYTSGDALGLTGTRWISIRPLTYSKGDP